METIIEQFERALERWQKMQPLNQYDQEKFSRRFSIDFNYNSNHIEGNTLTYGQTELLLLFGRVVQEAEMRDLEEMKASDVGLKMMTEEATMSVHPLTETFIRQLHKTLLREDYEVYRNLPGGVTTSYTIHAGQYKTRPNSVITRYGDRFDYASPEETPALMSDLVWWYYSCRIGHSVPLSLHPHPPLRGWKRSYRPPVGELHSGSSQLPDGCGSLSEETGILRSPAPGRPSSGESTF